MLVMRDSAAERLFAMKQSEYRGQTRKISFGSYKGKKADIALHGNPVSELRDVTCHMGSHSVTCHPTQVNAPRLTPAMQPGTGFTYPGGN